MDPRVYFACLVSILHLNYESVIKLLNYHLAFNTHKICVYAGCTSIITIINIYFKPNFYTSQQSILYETYGTILNLIFLSCIGLLNGITELLIDTNIKVYPDNPSGLIILYRCEIVCSSIVMMTLFSAPVRAVDIIFPFAGLIGIYYINDGGYLYDKIDIENPGLINERNNGYLCTIITCYVSTGVCLVFQVLTDSMIFYTITNSVNIMYIMQGYFTGKMVVFYLNSYWNPSISQTDDIYLRDRDNRININTLISIGIICTIPYYFILFITYSYFQNISNIKTITLSNIALTTLISKYIYQVRELYDIQCKGIILVFEKI